MLIIVKKTFLWITIVRQAKERNSQWIMKLPLCIYIRKADVQNALVVQT
jgi:hypothetical protein